MFLKPTCVTVPFAVLSLCLVACSSTDQGEADDLGSPQDLGQELQSDSRSEVLADAGLDSGHNDVPDAVATDAAADIEVPDSGDDGCLGSCGACLGIQDVCEAGVCICKPACDGKECGDDGCGGDCGSCTGPTSCLAGLCAVVCSDGLCGPGEACSTCPEDCGECTSPGFVPIPSGAFWMGTPAGGPGIRRSTLRSTPRGAAGRQLQEPG